MARGWRLLWRIAAFLIVVTAAVAFLSYRNLLVNALPKTIGTLDLPDLRKPVEVYRDDWGVPHIFAENDPDLFRAAGFVAAQDRLWQMDFYRRAATGRLSEVFGEKTLEDDKFLRLWGFDRIARAISDTLSAQSRLALQAYAAGVNAFIESHKTDYPIEFSLLKYKPEKWRIEDSIAFTRLMAWKLSFSWYVEPVLSELVARLGPQRAREVFPDFPKQGPLVIPQQTRPFWSEVQHFLKAGELVHNLLGIHGGRIGSNAWAVSGRRTECGKPILANDPHLELMTPAIWYEMHLSSPSLDVAGVTLPGVPGVVIGHNQNIAWGLTNGMVDDVDFYVERINPQDSTQYWDGRNWLTFETVIEEIAVKDGQTVTLEIRSTRNGIVVSDMHPVWANGTDVISMKWVGQTPTDDLGAYLNLMQAADRTQFIDALRGFTVPAQNFVFATAEGDIGYQLAGRIPIRHRTTGLLPHQGWRLTGQWLSDVPFEHLPHLLNPEQGYIATANNKIVSDSYPYYLSDLWEPPGRAERIQQWFAGQDTFAVRDFQAMQQDIESSHARLLMTILTDALQPRVDSTANDSLRVFFNLIKDWSDGIESQDSIPVSIYHAFLYKVTENTLKDEMGDSLYQHYIKTSNVPLRVITSLLQKERSNWFDDVTTEHVETKDDILEKSLLDGVRMLRARAGDSIANWRWGEIHTLTMRHVLGVVEPLGVALNIGPFAMGGSTMTINNSEHRFSQPFDSVIGPSMRQIVDLCDPQHALAVMPTGQSGQRLSDHYKDQTSLWLQGEYRSRSLNKAEVQQSAPHKLLLVPTTAAFE